jgi:hypothetical protein
MVREPLEGWVGQSPDLQFDHCTKAYVRFIPKKLDADVLKQGSGWTSTGRMLLLEVVNTEDALSVKLIIGPGPADLRQKLFDAAFAKKTLFNSVTKFPPHRITIFAHKLMPRRVYELSDGEFEKELQKQWKRVHRKRASGRCQDNGGADLDSRSGGDLIANTFDHYAPTITSSENSQAAPTSCDHHTV